MSNFIKLTSFDKFSYSPDDLVATGRIFEDLLINPAHVIKVFRKKRTITTNGLTYKPTVLVLQGGTAEEVAESFEAVHILLKGMSLAGRPRYVLDIPD